MDMDYTNIWYDITEVLGKPDKVIQLVRKNPKIFRQIPFSIKARLNTTCRSILEVVLDISKDHMNMDHAICACCNDPHTFKFVLDNVNLLSNIEESESYKSFLEDSHYTQVDSYNFILHNVREEILGSINPDNVSVFDRKYFK